MRQKVNRDIEDNSYVSGILPNSGLCQSIPVFKGSTCIWMPFAEILDDGPLDDSHRLIMTTPKMGVKAFFVGIWGHHI